MSPDLAGTIRNNGSGWAFIDDAGHSPVGFCGVTSHPGYLELHYPKVAQIKTFLASLDETFAATSLRIGTSVGLDVTRLYFYTAAPAAWPVPNTAVNPASVVSTWGNIWLAGWTEPVQS